MSIQTFLFTSEAVTGGHPGADDMFIDRLVCVVRLKQYFVFFGFFFVLLTML
jgi:hypothetical protein